MMNKRILINCLPINRSINRERDSVFSQYLQYHKTVKEIAL